MGSLASIPRHQILRSRRCAEIERSGRRGTPVSALIGIDFATMRIVWRRFCPRGSSPPPISSALSLVPVALGGIHEGRGVLTSRSRSTAGGTRHDQDRDHDSCPNCGRDLLCHRVKPRYSLPACVYQDMCSPSTSRRGVQSTSNNTSREQQFESEGLRHYTVSDREHRGGAGTINEILMRMVGRLRGVGITQLYRV